MAMLNEQTVKLARNVDMIVFLQTYYGFVFDLHRGSYRCREHQSLAVDQDRISWFWHSKGKGGCGPITWLMQIENMPFRKAVEIILSTQPAAPPQKEWELPGPLALPKKRPAPVQLYRYLCDRRGIQRSIVEALVQEGKLYEDCRGNVVFVGHDATGAARFASLRGTYGDCKFRRDCAGSDKRYGFHMDARVASNRLYVFESAADAMSSGTLANIRTSNPDAWLADHRLSLAGTSDIALPFFLKQHPNVHELVFSLDSDPAGRTAASAFAQKYAAMGYATRLEIPRFKDVNEDLLHLNADRCTNGRNPR